MPKAMPTTKPTTDRLPISDAGLELKKDYHDVFKELLRGTLQGGRDERGRWYVTRESVQRAKVRAEAEAEALEKIRQG